MNESYENHRRRLMAKREPVQRDPVQTWLEKYWGAVLPFIVVMMSISYSVWMSWPLIRMLVDR